MHEVRPVDSYLHLRMYFTRLIPHSSWLQGSPRDVMANVLDWIVSEFEIQSRYCLFSN